MKMTFLGIMFAILALLAVYGGFRYGINYSPFYFKQSSIYFLYTFLLCFTAAVGFYLAAKEEAKEENEERKEQN